jgi:ribonuclease VapC
VIVDASIVIAYVLDEPHADWVEKTFERTQDQPRRITWINAAEIEITLSRGVRALRPPLNELLRQFKIETLTDDFESTRLVAEGRRRFPLHFGDCFAYAHARLLDEPLMTLDADFFKTDLPRIFHPDRTRP